MNKHLFSFFDLECKGLVDLVFLLLLHRQLKPRTLIKYEVDV